MSQKFQIEAVLDGMRPLKDGSMSLTFHTNEVSKDQKVVLMDFYNSFGWLLFAANAFQENEAPKDSAKRDVGKSPSERLRSVIFVRWKQLGGHGDFEAYYRQRMEQHIDHEKQDLN